MIISSLDVSPSGRFDLHILGDQLPVMPYCCLSYVQSETVRSPL